MAIATESRVSGNGVAAEGAAGRAAPGCEEFDAIFPVLTSSGMNIRQMHFPAIVLAIAASSAQADESFRCGQWIVSSDLTVEELASRCGPPTSQESRTEDIMVRNQYGVMVKDGETVTETWTYDRGTRAAPMVVTIVDGKIRSIERKK